MESIVKKLRQEQAILGARQGDPEAPASGTLLARRTRLCADLERVEAELSGRASRSGAASAVLATHRAALTLRRELNLVNDELLRTKRRIQEIDQLIAQAAGQPERCRKPSARPRRRG